MIKIYTDGACTKNGRAGSKGGFGVYSYGLIEHSENVPNNTTNNICELLGIKYALEWVRRTYPNGDVLICSDSVYSMNCVTKWIHGWKRNNWLTSNSKPVKNKELIESISNLLDELNVSQNITFKYVSNNKHRKPPINCDGTITCNGCDGPCNNEDWVGNHEADRLATSSII